MHLAAHPMDTTSVPGGRLSAPRVLLPVPGRVRPGQPCCWVPAGHDGSVPLHLQHKSRLAVNPRQPSGTRPRGGPGVSRQAAKTKTLFLAGGAVMRRRKQELALRHLAAAPSPPGPAGLGRKASAFGRIRSLTCLGTRHGGHGTRCKGRGAQHKAGQTARDTRTASHRLHCRGTENTLDFPSDLLKSLLLRLPGSLAFLLNPMFPYRDSCRKPEPVPAARNLPLTKINQPLHIAGQLERLPGVISARSAAGKCRPELGADGGSQTRGRGRVQVISHHWSAPQPPTGRQRVVFLPVGVGG